MTSPAEALPPRGRRVRSERCVVIDLADGWLLAPGEPGTDAPPESGWLPARTPGAVADVLRDAGIEPVDLDDRDWWWRHSLDVPPVAPGEELIVEFEGITPYADVLVDGRVVATATSMFVPVAVAVPGPVELQVRCRALGPVLAQPRRPRSRWRTAVADNALRFVRTTLFGRAPGFAPGPPIVGPWRPVRAHLRTGVAVDALVLRADTDGATGRLTVELTVRGLGATTIEGASVVVSGPSGPAPGELTATGPARWSGIVSVADVALWWPHTHGRPVLHDVAIDLATSAGAVRLDAGRVGFRTLSAGATATSVVTDDGLDLHVNGVRVFARGAVWTRPGGPLSRLDLRATLELARDSGMNMLRVPGTAVYETADMHDLCDELGILLWQDAMLANFDYPDADESFMQLLERECTAVLAELAGRPSFAVFCGGSEVEQQATMLGQDPATARGPITTDLLPRLLAESGCDAVWVPSSPCGGDLPFRTNRGVAHYYGVGGYRRPFSDVRQADVRFAAESLALSNIPGDALLETLSDGAASTVLESAAWHDGVPRDRGASWNFEDVRDFYLELLHGWPAAVLRRESAQRYLDVSRQVSGEVMSEVYGEWRRGDARCGGGLVLWLADVRPGAGWGLLDSTGRPKPVLAALGRILQPVAVWMTDEGLNGVDVHVANDGPAALDARLDLALYRADGVAVGSAGADVHVPPHGSWSAGVEQLLGRFEDVSWAYRFGPPAQDAVVATLTDGTTTLGAAVRLLGAAMTTARPAGEVGLVATATADDGGVNVDVSSDLLAYGVAVEAAGHVPADSGFFLVPGQHRAVRLHRAAPTTEAPAFVRLTAVNVVDAVVVQVGGR